MYLDHVRRYVNIKELLAGLCIPIGGGAACYPKYTKSFGDARSAFTILPSSCPSLLPPLPLSRPFLLFHHPISPRRDLDIMLDKLTIQSNTKGYTASLAATVGRRINLSVLWKLIKRRRFRVNRKCSRLEIV